MSLLIVLDTAAVLLFVLILDRVVRNRRTECLPPGPPGWPVIGNVLDMPTASEWKTFAAWGERWGNIVSVTLFGQHMVILNSSQVAIEMFDQKSSIYSDRPVMTMGGKLVGWDRTLAMARYGSRFRHTRRLFSQLIGSGNLVQKFSGHLENEVQQFLARIRREPETLLEHIRKTTGAIILKMAYGYRVEEGEDALISLVDRAVDGFSKSTVPGAFLVDIFPMLQYVPAWVPGAGWKKKAKAWGRDLDMMCDVPYEFTKEQMSAGTATPSFTSAQLEKKPSPEVESIIKDAASSLYSAGGDTTVSAIHTFFLAMTCFPEVQRKAHAEIDAVVGCDRLPVLADRDRLPYVNALCLEVLRWQPVVPLGLPHRLTKDDFHAGYLLPEGTVVFPNIWKFLHDPKVYANPFTFNPDRFLPLGGREPEKDPRQVVFGFGRRICPGRHLAEASLFLACAMSLSVFEIAKTVKDDVVVEPVIEYTSGTISHPHEFDCSIKPRSVAAEGLIHTMHDYRQE